MKPAAGQVYAARQRIEHVHGVAIVHVPEAKARKANEHSGYRVLALCLDGPGAGMGRLRRGRGRLK